MNSPAPGWHPDPTSRHQYRYWDGARWTDDVADGGVASTDALGEPEAPASDPNVPTEPTYPPADTTEQVDPTRQYPGAQQPGPSSTPYYGNYSGGSQPPAPPAKKGPPGGLIAALAVVAVALIGGLVYLIVRDDDSGSSDAATEASDGDSTTSEPDNPDNSDDSNSGGSGDSGTSDSTLPDDIGSENVDQLVEFMADNMEQASGGVLSHEEATCISQGMLDELGLERIVDIGESGDNPFTDPELTSRLFGIMEDCGVSLEDLATTPD
ncbi:MAG: DUF2510 domain-containing protein [Acidimicrobiales bacterium]